MVVKEKRSKFEPFEKKGIFIGYSETTKGYRVYIPGQKSIEIIRDVKFDEDIAFKSSLNKEDEEIENQRELIIEENYNQGENTIQDNSTRIMRESLSEDRDMSASNAENDEDLRHKKRPLWARKMIEENNVELDEVSRENKEIKK